jgi:hypothetical protein
MAMAMNHGRFDGEQGSERAPARRQRHQGGHREQGDDGCVGGGVLVLDLFAEELP